MANYPNHRLVTKAALSVQPGWVHDLLGAEEKRLTDHYCLYGDLAVSGSAAQRKRVRPFMRLPGVRMAPMGPVSLDERENVQMWRAEYEHWFSRIAAAIRKGRFADAAQYLGVVSHAIGDTAALPHPLSQTEGLRMELIRRLFPTTTKHRHMSLHNLLEDQPTRFSLNGRRPRLLGLHAEEAAFHAAQGLRGLATRTLAKIAPALRALYSSRMGRVREIAGRAYADGARIYADVLYTALALGTSRVGDDERARLERTPVAVDVMVPHSVSGWAPYPYFFKPVCDSPCNFTMRMEPYPLKLLVGGRRRTFTSGFGLGVGAFVEHRLPEDTYDRLTAVTGLNAGLAQKLPLTLRIGGDGRVLFKKTFRSASDSASVDADVRGVSTLRVETAAARAFDRFGKIECHGVVAEPLLHRRRPSSCS